MSISSSERFFGNGFCLDISSNSDGVLIEIVPTKFENINSYFFNGISSDTVQINTNPYVGAGVNDAANDAFRYTVTSSISLNTDIHIVGFGLYIQDGFLKCEKHELSSIDLVHSASYIKAKDRMNISPCYLNEMLTFINNQEMLNYIQKSILDIAHIKGIYPDIEFISIVDHYDGVMKKISCPALTWLSYPLVRELGSVSFANNLSLYDRQLICPDFQPMNFKQLVEKYYGTSTNKMLEEIWKVVVIGTEKEMEQLNNPFYGAIPTENSPIPQIEIQPRTKALQALVFTLGPAIFKTLGFDYFYQVLPKFSHTNTLRHEYPLNQEIYKDYISILLKFLTPKKLVGILPELTINKNVELLKDATIMLTDYSTQDNIPMPLKNQFPNGLGIDFNFKTIKEMHDKISADYTIIKAEASKKEITVHPLYAKLDGLESNGLKFVVPTNTTFLSKWGSELSMCVASYGDNAANGKTILLGIEKDGQIKYCIEFHSQLFGRLTVESHENYCLPKLEIRKSLIAPEGQEICLMPSIVQFRGKGNGDPKPEDKIIVENTLVKWVLDNKEELEILLGSKENIIHENYMAPQDGIGNLIVQGNQLMRIDAPQIIIPYNVDNGDLIVQVGDQND